ncbi:hypothetical protein Y1Q_0003671 [Alligator mississippiensis]|uniref:Uncharacterized protein n=1 Tax=Alligator mississippiensis TaxID=8496 RepID=A0A151MSM5_ALLMI|nr:hypothetical protein Y1Q_0003671 [Alligator mississippiensis]
MRVQQILHMLENYNPPLISEKEFHLSVFLEKMRGAQAALKLQILHQHFFLAAASFDSLHFPQNRDF